MMYDYLIDTHCHLNFPQYDGNLVQIIQKCAKVKYFINPGVCLETSQKAVTLATEFKEIFAAVGIHPHESDQADEQTLQQIRQLIGDKVVAVGEVGLDYFKSAVDQKTQQNTFEQFIQLAIDYQKPLIIHNRMADADTLAILKNFNGRVNFVIHCYSADVQYAQKFLDLGGYLSFTGNITYPKADNIRESAFFAPLERIMLETDSPFLAPQSKRGQVNTPEAVYEVAQTISVVKNLPLAQVISSTTANALSFFNLAV